MSFSISEMLMPERLHPSTRPRAMTPPFFFSPARFLIPKRSAFSQASRPSVVNPNAAVWLEMFALLGILCIRFARTAMKGKFAFSLRTGIAPAPAGSITARKRSFLWVIGQRNELENANLRGDESAPLDPWSEGLAPLASPKNQTPPTPCRVASIHSFAPV